MIAERRRLFFSFLSSGATLSDNTHVSTQQPFASLRVCDFAKSLFQRLYAECSLTVFMCHCPLGIGGWHGQGG